MRSQIREWVLLGVLALLWGSSYLFIKIAVSEITPLTLIALRVLGAALLLYAIMRWRNQSLPRSLNTWRMLMVQSFLNCYGAWTLLAWGQQHVDAGLASVLNSTSPIFVFALAWLVTGHESTSRRKLLGALIGITGVVFIVGTNALQGLGVQVLGQLACLVGAMLYAVAAIYGKRFAQTGPLATATGVMICAVIILVPAAFIFEQPLSLTPSGTAIAATIALSVLCTGVAMLIYFRLVQTLGSMGVASQAYLRAGFGVLLGMLVLGETFSPTLLIGLVAAITGVMLINWPSRQ